MKKLLTLLLTLVLALAALPFVACEGTKTILDLPLECVNYVYNWGDTTVACTIKTSGVSYNTKVSASDFEGETLYGKSIKSVTYVDANTVNITFTGEGNLTQNTGELLINVKSSAFTGATVKKAHLNPTLTKNFIESGNHESADNDHIYSLKLCGATYMGSTTAMDLTDAQFSATNVKKASIQLSAITGKSYNFEMKITGLELNDTTADFSFTLPKSFFNINREITFTVQTNALYSIPSYIYFK